MTFTVANTYQAKNLLADACVAVGMRADAANGGTGADWFWGTDSQAADALSVFDHTVDAGVIKINDEAVGFMAPAGSGGVEHAAVWFDMGI